ncbi:hypothetical protein ARMGADRAFT_607153 [Armillaria gallica]|uniref:Wax synthase domain-containing protein n=1 Tax=Armillaria gallica TaxID=47427 RepID=A0A2H3CMQ6_ARMGA|nr:hypothetical protein ARMGADRAFT_607153 [Armillaria gallica]
MTRIRRVLCSFLIHYLTCFFSVAATGPEFAPFALVAFITAYALAPDFGFPVPIYHGVHTCLHNLLRYVCWNSQSFVPNTDYICCQALLVRTLHGRIGCYATMRHQGCGDGVCWRKGPGR